MALITPAARDTAQRLARDHQLDVEQGYEDALDELQGRYGLSRQQAETLLELYL